MQQIALVVGEALVDVVKGEDGTLEEFPGGSAANVAVALARLDRPTWFVTCLADDHYGTLLREHLARADVRIAGDPGSVDHSSSAVATIGPDGSASYAFDVTWRLNPVELPADLEPVAVHTSSIAAVLPPGADDVLALIERVRGSAIVSYDVNARPALTGVDDTIRGRVERLATVSDLVKASDEDLLLLYPGRSVEDSAAALLSLGPAAVVVTRGGDGASWVSRTSSGLVGSVPVTVADTIGAGDTFGAGLLDALWQRGLVGAAHREALHALPAETWAEILGFAAGAAAVTVSRPGANPPYRHELG